MRRYSWAILGLVFIATVFVGCGGVGGGLASGGHAVSMFSGSGSLSIRIAAPATQAPLTGGTVTNTTTTTATTTTTSTSTSTGIASFRVHALDPSSGQDLIPPVLVNITSGSTTTTVTLSNVPTGAVEIEVEGLDSSLNLVSLGTSLITVTAGTNAVAAVTPTPVASGSSGSTTTSGTGTPFQPTSQHFVLVADEGTSTMETYTLSSSGTLNQVGNPQTDPAPSPIPTTLAAAQNVGVVYVGNLGAGDLNAFKLDPTTGVPAAIGAPFPVSLNESVEASITDLTQSFLYVLGTAASPNLSELTIDPTTGSVTAPTSYGSLLSGGIQGDALAVVPDPADPTHKQILVAAIESGTSAGGYLQPLILSNATGQLTSDGPAVQVFAPISSLFGMGSSIFVAANSTGGPELQRYDLNVSGGLNATPTQSTGLGGSHVTSVVVNSGGFIFAADQDSDVIKVGSSSFSPLSTTTLPAVAPGVTFQGQGPVAMALASPQVGSYLIVAMSGQTSTGTHQGSPAVDVFSINTTTGALTPVSEAILPVSPVRAQPASVYSY